MTRSICVIDDDQIYQIIVKKMISMAGIFENVLCYENAYKALEELKDPEIPLPNLILLDINMPGMDGWEFLSKLKEHRPQLGSETSIYIVTSSISFSDRDKAEAIPEVSGFISKPLSVAKLRELGEKS
ncbi:response regulator [Gillisia limnaea]|uniref:Response regulator receiver protein n=1 Tax=Gillisia limnaea (strain DSM 15749 / LMG 21470 / R-8282) TaxID=865937 RepID=H2C018_GILLR|nr:response regulator [Gillisia limnaea]EHQ02385.1 response regulator receiver protein [Gillisia limnaea DSM 15749]